MRALLPMVLAVLCLIAPSSGQSAPSSDDLTKENREFRAYADRLEAKVRDLESRLKSLQERQLAPFRYQPTPWPGDQSPFRMPNTVPPRKFDFRFTPPGRPSTQPFVFPDGPPTLPPGGFRFRFNGEDVYVIPLRSAER